MTPRWPLFMAVVVATGGSAVGCTGDSPDGRQTPAAPPRPVVESSPYLCDFVPEKAFQEVTGLNIGLNVRWAGPQTDNGLCLAHAKGRQAPLGVRWSYNDGADIVRRQQEDTATQSYPLPREMGEGLAVIRPTSGANPRPNYVIALFRCGGKRPWISIDFAPVVRGRDALQDMFDFMRIAQKRFGEIHECTPKP